MPSSQTRPRDLDLVLLGATGFTGALTAEYLAEHAPLRAALGAGRPQPVEARGGPRPARRSSTRRWPTSS